MSTNPISFPYNLGPIDPNGLPRDGLYAKGMVKLFELAARCMTWDGRVFRYAYSSGACYTGQLNAHGSAYALASTTSAEMAIGDIEIKFASAIFAKDILRGGFITIFGGTINNSDCPQRGIVGNTECSSSAVSIYLETAVERIVNSGQFCEVYHNPYYGLTTAGGGLARSFAGVANTYISASGFYFWEQTWGPCWMAPHEADFGAGGNMRDCYARGDGSISGLESHDQTKHNNQRIGYIIPTGLDAGPLVMLQLNI